MLLKNKTAVVTGCNRGIGKEILKTFAENGAEIFACARKETPEFAEHLKALSAATGAAIAPVYFDLSREEEVKAAVRCIIATKKKIDVLVNNAGVAAGGLFQMTSAKDLRSVFDVNFFSQVLFSQDLSRYMARFKSGSIINVGSTAGLIGNAGTTSYGGSKAALMYVTKVMATELGPMNVRVNAVAPSVTKTDMYEQMSEQARAKLIENCALRRPGEAREIADVVLFLASDLSSYVTGQVIRVDGGLTN